jgi:hypothetical protein
MKMDVVNSWNIENGYPALEGLYDPEMLKDQKCKIVKIIEIPIIYTGSTDVRMTFLVTFQFEEEDYWSFFEDEYRFIEFQEECYRKSPFFPESSGTWDHDKFTHTFWCKSTVEGAIKFIPSVEQYFDLLQQYNHDWN